MLIDRLEGILDEEVFIEETTISYTKRLTSKYVKFLVTEQTVKIDIPLIATGNNGVYIFLNEDDIVHASHVRLYFLNKLKMRDGVFIFTETKDGNGTYYDDVSASFIDFEDFYGGLTIFRQNHMIPECFKHKYKFNTAEDYFNDVYEPLEDEDDEESLYIRPIISNSKLDEIDLYFAELENEPIEDGKYLIYPDGSMKIKKFISRGFVSGEYTYPCSDENPNKVYWLTAMFGWLGFHKFYHKKIGQGILYLLTCGLVGVLPLFDLISMLSGDYYYTDVEYEMNIGRKIEKSAQRIYLKPLEKKLFCLLGVVLVVVLSLLAYKFLYQPAWIGISELLSSLGESLIDVNTGEIEGIIEGIPLE